MTREERIRALHTKTDMLKCRAERRRTAALGAACGGLALFLGIVLFPGGVPCRILGPFSGAVALFDSAGGYVLTAVAAFMAGVTVTVLLLKKRGTKGAREEAGTNEPEETVDFLPDGALYGAAGGLKNEEKAEGDQDPEKKEGQA